MEETKQPLRCKMTNKLLARINELGIYLMCKECRQEEFFTWQEIKEKLSESTQQQ